MKDFTDKIGHSPSPVIERATHTNLNPHNAVTSAQEAVNAAHNKQDIPVGELNKQQQ